MKDTDKIVKQHDGFKEMSAVAKMGTALFKQYENVKILLATESAGHVVKMFNRMTRVDSINAVNRPEGTPSPVRELGKLAKTSTDNVKAEIAAAVQAILDKHKTE